MFGWRRRSEGFEWKEYVRTTVLIRRADRHRRIEDARVAAIEKVKGAADAGVDASRAGASAVKSGLGRLLTSLAAIIADIAIAAFWSIVRWSAFASNVARDAARAIFSPLRDALRIPADAAREKLASLPEVARRSPIKGHHLISAALFLGLIYVGGPMLRSADHIGGPQLNIESGTRESSGQHQVTISSEISGLAVTLTGDTMRVDGTLVRLQGIEAPAPAQPCYRESRRRWNCASSARAGLDAIVRGRKVTCNSSGQDDEGRTLASCLVDDGKDIATQLVQSGLVFAADASFFDPLRNAESDARAAKRGIWQGEVMRPRDWRNERWEAAKHDAPDGCPIKGVLRASAKIYALPWSEAYATARVRPERGGRWFCSEDDAKAAGFVAWEKS
jgi:endonuclease YncB( thermonuclease family)